MMQFLNNIWVALNTPNETLVNILVIPLFLIESTLLMYMFLIIFNINSNRKQKIIYMICNPFIGIINLHFIPSPFNVLINYTCTFIFIKIIFKLDLLKSFVSLITPAFIFGLINILIQNPY